MFILISSIRWEGISIIERSLSDKFIYSVLSTMYSASSIMRILDHLFTNADAFIFCSVKNHDALFV